MKRMVNAYDRIIDPVCEYLAQHKKKRNELAEFLAEYYGRRVRVSEIHRWLHPDPTQRTRMTLDLGILVLYWYWFEEGKKEK